MEQISEGIYFCIENATNIFGDAYILIKENRFPRALSLLLLSIQEAGKVNILKNMAMISTRNQKLWQKEWKSFRKHEFKDFLGHNIKIYSEFNNSPGEAFWQLLIQKIHNSNSEREKVRQLGLYVDYITGDKRWWSPNEINGKMVKTVESEVIKILYKLQKEKEIGFFSATALQIYKEEFSDFHPKIELGKEYEIEDFGKRIFGLKEPYKKYLSRLIEEGVLNKISDNLNISGKHWKKFIYGQD